MPRTRARWLLLLALFLEGALPYTLRAENGYDLWLRYVPVSDAALLAHYRAALRRIVVEGESPTMRIVRDELNRALDGLLGTDVPTGGSPAAGSLLVGTPASSGAIARLGWRAELDSLGPEGFVIRSALVGGQRATVIASSGEVGALYGAFHLLRLVQTGSPIGELAVASRPAVRRRMLNHWDNLDGTIERGYAGPSLWKWEELPGRVDPRILDYARANASIGINAVVLNNVNADPRILRGDYLPKVAAIADALRPYGIRVHLSANFGAPLPPSATPDESKAWGGIGDLDTADPLDPRVRRWWRAKAEEIYRLVPDFGGFLVKANSEGMPGPNDYERSHAEGANMLAEALAPHGGTVIWRAFVYPRNADPDRAKRSYAEFVPLDGRFAPNVFLQPKNGPLDFQPREPFHPLFGAMPRTPLMAELQITQEYLGHSTHLVYLAPLWEELLDADTHAQGAGTTVARILAGPVDGHSMSGIAGVANVGADPGWTGHHFAQANWYAFGRLAWDPALSSGAIAEEWARMTWSNDARVVSTVKAMMLGSWRAAVNYMTPLGLSFTVEGGEHYQPEPEDREGDFWHSDSVTIGYDRSTRGSGYVSQYAPPLRNLWDDPATTPVEDLLWFHRVRWDRPLPTGRTVWEELTYRYYSGARYVDFMREAWLALADDVDAQRWRDVNEKLAAQRAHARLWRDANVGYFRSRSGLAVPPEAAALEAP